MKQTTNLYFGKPLTEARTTRIKRGGEMETKGTEELLPSNAKQKNNPPNWLY